jgi:hypothetical protein
MGSYGLPAKVVRAGYIAREYEGTETLIPTPFVMFSDQDESLPPSAENGLPKNFGVTSLLLVCCGGLFSRHRFKFLNPYFTGEW